MAAASAAPPPAASASAPHRDWKFVAKTLIAGGIAGACAKTVTAPLDRLKILFQVNSPYYNAKDGVVRNLVRIGQQEGLLAFYKGNGVQIIRVIPYAAIQFMAYEQLKKITQDATPVAAFNKLAAGSLAGCAGVLATYPLDLARARFASQVSSRYYRNVWDCLRQVVLYEGGFRALYHGLAPTLWGIAPYAGLSFSSFETMKELAKQHDVGKYVPLVVVNMCSGALAGAVAQTATFPLDVVRRRMQLQGIKDRMEFDARVARGELPANSAYVPTVVQFRATWQELIHVYRVEGFKALFRGLSLNYLRVVPAMAVSFTTYEFMKKQLEISGDAGHGGGGGG